MKRLLSLAMIALTACAHAQRVSPRYPVDHAFSVALDRPWADVSRSASPRPSPHVHLLTIHGPALESLYLVGGLKSGDRLWASARSEDYPRYRADFSRSEIVEFVTTSVTALGYLEVTARNIRPAALGAENGVRFDMEMRTIDGLNVSGTALAAQSGDRLNLILFLAPSEHFYPELMPEIDRMMVAAAAG